MFTQEQIQLLNQELDSNRIKTRDKGNINLSYLEGFDVIETANAIFGFGNWSYSITTLEKVSEEQNSNQNTIICYKAIVRVIVGQDAQHSKESVSREDAGFGTGIAKTLADAHESGAKEAVTDALKRAMRSFGNQFGNSLYDKSKNHQINQQPQNNQSHNQTSYTPNNAQQPQKNNQPVQNYTMLNSLGLQVINDGSNLVVSGENIYAHKNEIKGCGFKWNGANRQWYKPLTTQQVA